jgi:ABC-type phosphate transport system substrate-binding protein
VSGANGRIRSRQYRDEAAGKITTTNVLDGRLNQLICLSQELANRVDRHIAHIETSDASGFTHLFKTEPPIGEQM